MILELKYFNNNKLIKKQFTNIVAFKRQIPKIPLVDVYSICVYNIRTKKVMYICKNMLDFSEKICIICNMFKPKPYDITKR